MPSISDYPMVFDPQAWEANEQAAQINTQVIEQNKLELQSKELALRAAKRAETAQLKLAETLQARKAEFSADMEKNPDTALAKLAMETALAGDIAAASEMLVQSSQARENSYAAVKSHAETVNLEARRYEGVLSSVTDEESARIAAIELMQLYPEDGPYINELLLKGYDPEKIATARQGLINMKEQAQIDLIRAQESYNKQKTEESRVNMETVLPSRVRANDALATNRKKSGVVTTKGDKDIKTRVKNLLSTKYDVPTTDAANLDLMADDVVIRMRDILQSSPTMDKLEAADKAYEQLAKEGNFDVYGLKVGTPYSPLPPPMKDGKIDEESVETGMSYILKLKGRPPEVYTWNGSDWITPRIRRISDIAIDEGEPEDAIALTEEEE